MSAGDQPHFALAGRASNDHIRYLANHAACTIVGTGVDLEDSPLLSEGRSTGRSTQTSGRFSQHKLRPPIPGSEVWRR